ncbi:MAG: hypothetical protein O7C67_13365 [Gammaproteobacteria bacterium]|nr:hypothetical protein [Gammaproteobacteria bacterium]
MWDPLWLLLLFASAPVSVYYCVVDAVPTYSDRFCPNSTPLKIHAPPPVPFVPLDAQEQRALQALDARLANAAEARAGQRARYRRRHERERSNSDKACHGARQALDNLEAQRRKGYRLQDVSKLAAAERQHVETMRQHCR